MSDNISTVTDASVPGAVTDTNVIPSVKGNERSFTKDGNSKSISIKSVQKSVTSDPADFNTEFDDYVLNARTTGTDTVKKFIKFMDEYLIKMAPTTSLSGIPAAEVQESFFRILKNIIEKTPSEEFNKTWNLVLSYFWRYRSEALNERYVNRFAEYWTHKDINLMLFQRLVSLCQVSANPAVRNDVKKYVDIAKTMETGYSTQGSQNIFQFYKV